jgi:hypothetical protein
MWERFTYIRERGHEDLDLIQLVQDRDHQLTFVNTMMDLKFQ